MSIGNRLQQERKRLGLSQDSLAQACGTTQHTQYSYESDITKPKVDYLAKVASMGIDVHYVITGERLENVACTPIELAYLRNARALQKKGLAQHGLDGLTFFRSSHNVNFE